MGVGGGVCLCSIRALAHVLRPRTLRHTLRIRVVIHSLGGRVLAGVGLILSLRVVDVRVTSAGDCVLVLLVEGLKLGFLLHLIAGNLVLDAHHIVGHGCGVVHGVGGDIADPADYLVNLPKEAIDQVVILLIGGYRDSGGVRAAEVQSLVLILVLGIHRRDAVVVTRVRRWDHDGRLRGGRTGSEIASA